MVAPLNGPVNVNQPLLAGAQPVGLNALANPAGIISLDVTHANEDPSTALLNEVVRLTGYTIDQLKTGGNGFTLDKGFRPDGADKSTPIPIFAYSNHPGPDCYYFVRHWRVEVKDPNNPNGPPIQMHFTKKIYTSVEVPRTLDGAAHTQQQYIAALAASTYAKVEESRIFFGNGQTNDLYNSIAGHISKIANDRFVTLEMFNNAQNVAINPLKEKDIKPSRVDTIHLRLRAGREGVEGELERENYHPILFNGERQADNLIAKRYNFIADQESSSHVKEVSTLLNRDGILHNIRERDRTPEQAFAIAQVRAEDMKDMQQGLINGKANNFYSHRNVFNNKATIARFMGDPLSDKLMNKIAPEPSIYRRITNKQPDHLAVLEGLHRYLSKPSRSDEQKDEVKPMLDTAIEAYVIMKREHDEISKIETELSDMGIGTPTQRTERDERQAILDEMKALIEPHAPGAIAAAINRAVIIRQQQAPLPRLPQPLAEPLAEPLVLAQPLNPPIANPAGDPFANWAQNPFPNLNANPPNTVPLIDPLNNLNNLVDDAPVNAVEGPPVEPLQDPNANQNNAANNLGVGDLDPEDDLT